MASPSRDSALDSDREIDSEDELIDYERMDAAPTTRTTETTRAVEDGEIEDARAESPARAVHRRAVAVDDPARAELSEEDLACAEHVRRSIEEPKGHLIRLLCARFGRDALGDALRETLRVERAGGAMYERGKEGSGDWARRTKAGCFLWTFKRRFGGGGWTRRWRRAKRSIGCCAREDEAGEAGEDEDEDEDEDAGWWTESGLDDRRRAMHVDE
tara:strand:+ start:5312 stop:5956 length:645 start_codon:yes stop_codon:yes gene_type:complete